MDKVKGHEKLSCCDLEKYQIYIHLDTSNPNDDLLFDLIFNVHWRHLYGMGEKIRYHHPCEKLSNPTSVMHSNVKLEYSQARDQMYCICKYPFEIWIENKHAQNFVFNVINSGWYCELNHNRHKDLRLLDPTYCENGTPSLVHILTAITEVKAQHIVLRSDGLRWEAKDKSNPIPHFFNGVDLMREIARGAGGTVSLTHIDIAQNIIIADAEIPRWTFTERKDKSEDTTSFHEKSKETLETKVKYYPGLTGDINGGFTVSNPGAYKCADSYGLHDMDCFNNNMYHFVDGSEGGVPSFDTTLTLPENMRKVMRTVLRYRFAFNECDKNSWMRSTFGLQHFISAAMMFPYLRRDWGVELSKSERASQP